MSPVIVPRRPSGAFTLLYLAIAGHLVLGVRGAAPLFCCYLQSSFSTSPDPSINVECSAVGCEYVYAGQQLVGFTMVDNCSNCTFAWPQPAPVVDSVNTTNDADICCLYSATPFLKLTTTPLVATPLSANGCDPVGTCMQLGIPPNNFGICGMNAFTWNYTATTCGPPAGLQTAAVEEAGDAAASVAMVSEDVVLSSDQAVCCFYLSVNGFSGNDSLTVMSTGGCSWDDLIAAYPGCLVQGFSHCMLIGFSLADSTTATCAPPQLDCNAYSDNCEVCGYFQSCAYCLQDGTCRNTTGTGEGTFATCPYAQQVNNTQQCSPVFCSAQTSCDDCLSTANCQWCSSSSTCISSRIFDFQHCPSGEPTTFVLNCPAGPAPSFFQQHKTLVIGGGIALGVSCCGGIAWGIYSNKAKQRQAQADAERRRLLPSKTRASKA